MSQVNGYPTSEQVDQSSLTLQQEDGREAILSAATTAFVTRGYAATSVDDIAELLSSSKGRIYHYYRTKGELFLGIHRQALDMCLAAIVPMSQGDNPAPQRLRDMIVAHIKLIHDENSLMKLGAQAAEIRIAGEGRTSRRLIDEVLTKRKQIEQLYLDVLNEGIKVGDFRSDDPSTMAKAILGTINWMTIWYSPQGGKRGANGLEAVTKTVSTFVLDGVLSLD